MLMLKILKLLVLVHMRKDKGANPKKQEVWLKTEWQSITSWKKPAEQEYKKHVLETR